MNLEKVTLVLVLSSLSLATYALKDSKLKVEQQALETVFKPGKIIKFEGPATLYTHDGLTEGAYLGLIVDKSLKKTRLSLVRKKSTVDLLASSKGVFVHALKVRKELTKSAKSFQGVVASLVMLLAGLDVKDSILSEQNFNWTVKFKDKKHEIKLTPKIKLLNISLIKILSSEDHKLESIELYTKDSTFGFVFESQLQSVVNNSSNFWSASKKLDLKHNKNFFYIDDSFKVKK